MIPNRRTNHNTRNEAATQRRSDTHCGAVPPTHLKSLDSLFQQHGQRIHNHFCTVSNECNSLSADFRCSGPGRELRLLSVLANTKRLVPHLPWLVQYIAHLYICVFWRVTMMMIDDDGGDGGDDDNDDACMEIVRCSTRVWRARPEPRLASHFRPPVDVLLPFWLLLPFLPLLLLAVGATVPPVAA